MVGSSQKKLSTKMILRHQNYNKKMAQKKMILRNDFQTPSTPSKSFPKVGVMGNGWVGPPLSPCRHVQLSFDHMSTQVLISSALTKLLVLHMDTSLKLGPASAYRWHFSGEGQGITAYLPPRDISKSWSTPKNKRAERSGCNKMQ